MMGSMDRHLFSVIIPTWNRSETIARTISSALRQTKGEVEVLVADDGSTDDTKSVVLGFGSKQVKWIDGERSGLPAVARNRGLKEAHGKWVAFLDSDDAWFDGKLERQMQLLQNSEVKAVCGNAIRLNHAGQSLGLFHGNEHVDDQLFTTEDLLKVNPIICSSVVVDRELVIDCGGFPELRDFRGVEDYALWLRISLRTPIGYVGEPLLYYTDDMQNSVRGAREDIAKIYRVVEQKTQVMCHFGSETSAEVLGLAVWARLWMRVVTEIMSSALHFLWRRIRYSSY